MFRRKGKHVPREDISGQLTHDRLKQSCEQKNELALPSFKQVGHCKVPAASAQAIPAQIVSVRGLVGASVVAILVVGGVNVG